jgi:hypothetical protein
MTAKREKESSVDVRFYRRSDAAESLSVSERCLSDWASRGIIPVIGVGKRCVLYSRADLEAALQRFRTAAIGEGQ